MKIEKFQLHGNNSVCAGALQLLRCHAPAPLRGNIGPSATVDVFGENKNLLSTPGFESGSSTP
jgi:hypothetical protein